MEPDDLCDTCGEVLDPESTIYDADQCTQFCCRECADEFGEF